MLSSHQPKQGVRQGRGLSIDCWPQLALGGFEQIYEGGAYSRSFSTPKGELSTNKSFISSKPCLRASSQAFGAQLHRWPS